MSASRVTQNTIPGTFASMAVANVDPATSFQTSLRRIAAHKKNSDSPHPSPLKRDATVCNRPVRSGSMSMFLQLSLQLKSPAPIRPNPPTSSNPIPITELTIDGRRRRSPTATTTTSTPVAATPRLNIIPRQPGTPPRMLISEVRWLNPGSNAPSTIISAR